MFKKFGEKIESRNDFDDIKDNNIKLELTIEDIEEEKSEFFENWNDYASLQIDLRQYVGINVEYLENEGYISLKRNEICKFAIISERIESVRKFQNVQNIASYFGNEKNKEDQEIRLLCEKYYVRCVLSLLFFCLHVFVFVCSSF